MKNKETKNEIGNWKLYQKTENKQRRIRLNLFIYLFIPYAYSVSNCHVRKLQNQSTNIVWSKYMWYGEW
jgi:hypothetical protein